MNWPNLFIPGAGKSGTSSLHEYLQQHPKIFMSQLKEPHYFSRPDFPNGLAEYEQLFADGERFLFRGESSTSYMVYPKVIDRIKSSVQSPKFIFILRNPVERSVSHYWWLKGMGYEMLSFKEAFLNDMRSELNFEQDFREGFIRHYYYHMGCYAKWIGPFLNVFGEDSVTVVSTEKLYKNPLETLNFCATFLGIDPFTEIKPVEKNRTMILKYPRLYYFLASLGWGNSPTRVIKSLIPPRFLGQMSNWRRKLLDRLKLQMNSDANYLKLDDDTRQWIGQIYQDDVRALRKMTGVSFTEWENDFPI